MVTSRKNGRKTLSEEMVISETSAEKPIGIEVPAIDVRQLEITIIGDSPLIMHKWSDKAKKQMLQKQMKEATKGREAKNPKEDFEQSMYTWPGPEGGYAFPAVAFKAAAVTASGDSDMKMTQTRRRFHVRGELVRIEGSEPVMREDMVRIAMGTADIRYRGEFKEWRANLLIDYNASAISPAQIINLFNLAGFGVGIGEWRPEKDGQFGRFHVASQNEIEKPNSAS